MTRIKTLLALIGKIQKLSIIAAILVAGVYAAASEINVQPSLAAPVTASENLDYTYVGNIGNIVSTYANPGDLVNPTMIAYDDNNQYIYVYCDSTAMPYATGGLISAQPTPANYRTMVIFKDGGDGTFDYVSMVTLQIAGTANGSSFSYPSSKPQGMSVASGVIYMTAPSNALVAIYQSTPGASTVSVPTFAGAKTGANGYTGSTLGAPKIDSTNGNILVAGNYNCGSAYCPSGVSAYSTLGLAVINPNSANAMTEVPQLLVPYTSGSNSFYVTDVGIYAAAAAAAAAADHVLAGYFTISGKTYNVVQINITTGAIVPIAPANVSGLNNPQESASIYNLYSMQSDKQGNIYLTGNFGVNTNGQYVTSSIIKIDSNGNFVTVVAPSTNTSTTTGTLSSSISNPLDANPTSQWVVTVDTANSAGAALRAFSFNGNPPGGGTGGGVCTPVTAMNVDHVTGLTTLNPPSDGSLITGSVQSQANYDNNMPAPIVMSTSPSGIDSDSPVTILTTITDSTTGSTITTSWMANPEDGSTQMTMTTSSDGNHVTSNGTLSVDSDGSTVSVINMTAPNGTKVTNTVTTADNSAGGKTVTTNKTITTPSGTAYSTTVVISSDSAGVITLSVGFSGIVAGNDYVTTVTSNNGASACSTLTEQWTALNATSVTAISPASGPEDGGQEVTITGTGFTGATSVTIGGSDCTPITNITDTSLKCTTAAGTAGTASVLVTSPGGTNAANTLYTYMAAPEVDSLSPDSGPVGGGTVITITGTGFASLDTEVTLEVDGLPCENVQVINDTTVTCTAPPHTAGPVDVVITTPGGTSIITGGFMYLDAPVVSSIAPSAGPTTGGDEAVIIGTGFNDATSVTIGGNPCNSFTVDSDTQITISLPAGSAGAQAIVVTTPGGTSNDTVNYTYMPAPTVTAVAPAAGSISGGETITITGTGFTGATNASIGGAPCTGFGPSSVVGDTQITCVAPAGSVGTASVVVTTPGGSNIANTLYTYMVAPTVTAITPAAGPTGGNQHVTITGTGFVSGSTTATVGGAACSDVQVASDTQLTCDTPGGSAGSADVVVTTPGGSATGSALYTYVAAPTITSISPTQGATSGGAVIAVTGTNFTDNTTTSVTIGGVACASFNVDSATSLPGTAPARTAGTVDLVVTTPGGTTTPDANSKFTYVDTPTVTAVSPASGPTTAGTEITITGTNFVGVTSVTIGGTACTSFTTNSPTQITCVAPAGTPGTASVLVTAVGGTNPANSLYTYVAAPVVGSVSPAQGPLTGGQSVAITGTGFTGATSVTIGGTACTSFSVNSDTSVTCITPPTDTPNNIPGGGVPVVVTTVGGASNDDVKYAYRAVPTITEVDPTQGPTTGGLGITLTNTDGSFGDDAANTTVTVDGLPCEIISVGWTVIQCYEPPHAAGTVNIVVTTSGGTSIPDTNSQYTYVAAPTVAAITPAKGPLSGTQTVTISGTGFIAGATSVTIGGANCTSVTVLSNTELTCTRPSGSSLGTASVVATTIGGSNSDNTLYTYVNAPTITTVTPNVGPLGGGQNVTITGTGFTGATSVTIGGATCTNVQVASDTQLTCTTPSSGSAGTASVVVTTLGGSSAANSLYTYIAAPTITSISPASGTTAGGQSITIAGANFTPDSTVKVGGNTCTITAVSSTSITCTTPPGTPGAADVAVTATGGTGSSAGGYTYVSPPVITNVDPDNGPSTGGTEITITGTGFSGATGVTVGGNACTVVGAITDTSITCETTAGSVGGASVVVTTPIGSSPTNTFYTYTDPTSIIRVTPNATRASGGASLVITGVSFTGATNVTIGGTDCTSFTVDSDTQITCSTPAGTPGLADVVVTAPGGTSTGTGMVTYVAAPTVTSVNPGVLPAATGGQITITGTGFNPSTSTVQGIVCANTVVVSDTVITCTAPPHAVGPAQVSVALTGSGPSNSGYIFYVDAPTVTSITDDVGPTTGGTLITITGTNFVAGTGNTTVTVGGNPCTIVTPPSGTPSGSLTCTTPPGTPGDAPVVVTTPAGTTTPDANSQFNYIAAPTVTAISPAAGPTGGGQTVTIGGTGFLGANDGTLPTVTIGDVSAYCTPVTNLTDTSLTCVTPNGSTGPASVVVTTIGGSSPANSLYTYVAAPTITSVSPNFGPTPGGTGIVIEGTGFSGTTGVTVGGRPCTNLIAFSDTNIWCITPGGNIGAADVVVTATGGPSTPDTASQFTYINIPVVTVVSQNSGPSAGGRLIVVTGNYFTPDSTITVGGQPCTPTTDVWTVTDLSCITPPGTPGAAPVVVTVPNIGASNSDVTYTYIGAPTVTAISPASGSVNGGTEVTITGTGFDGATGATIGDTGYCGADFKVVSNTEITCTIAVDSAATAGPASVLVATPGGTNAANTLYTFLDAPTIDSVTPSGPVGGGNQITINGDGFTPDSTVTIGDEECTDVVVSSDGKTITCTVPPGTEPGSENVIVTTPGGPSTPDTNSEYEYLSAPVITGLDPSKGPTTGGTTITITGDGFTSDSTVMIGGNACTSVDVSEDGTTITCDTPAGRVGSVLVQVTTPGGNSGIGTLFTYVAAPTITSISPASGPIGGGTTITITGTNLSGATGVTVDGLPCENPSFAAISDSTINCTTPPHAAGPVNIVVTTAGGSATANNSFTYLAAPTVTSVSPDSGPVGGGSTITIGGTGFTPGSTVTIGGQNCLNVNVVSATQITCDAPAGTVGDAPIVVTTPGGTSNSDQNFEYLPAPTVSGVSPTEGPTTGGTEIEITGTGFTDDSVVTIGGNTCTIVDVSTDGTSITCTTPAGTVGDAPIVVTTPGGTSGSNVNFKYLLAPVISAISPAEGPVGGGQTITITGEGYKTVSGTTVALDGAACTDVVVVSDTKITCKTPVHAAGPVSVVVTTDGGNNTTNSLYTYVDKPTVSAVDPDLGPTSGGMHITITGTGFTPDSTVTVGGTACANVAYVSDTEISCTTPAHGAGAASVEVTTPGGVSDPNSLYTYAASPTVTAVSPSNGPTAGGNTITIDGTNFTGATRVSVGPNACTSFTVNPAGTSITCVVPPGTLGTASVQVTTPGGASSPNTLYLYVDPPTVSAVDPNTGTTLGGTTITITGDNYVPGTTVTVGGNPCANVVVVNPTTITCTTPAGGPGSGDVVVTNPAGSSTPDSDSSFDYIDDPVLKVAAPGRGPTSGGGVLTLHGLNLIGATAVAIDGNDCPITAPPTYTTITCTIPPHEAGTYDVTVVIDTTVTVQNLLVAQAAPLDLVVITLPQSYTYYEDPAPGTPGAPGTGFGPNLSTALSGIVAGAGLITLSAGRILSKRK